MIVDAVIGVSTTQVFISNIIAGICKKVQAFKTKQISHVKQIGNRPTHIMAEYAKGIDSYVTWIEENPNIIEFALTQDVLLLSSS